MYKQSIRMLFWRKKDNLYIEIQCNRSSKESIIIRRTEK